MRLCPEVSGKEKGGSKREDSGSQNFSGWARTW